MFICNHCPYVKSILEQLVVEVSVLQKKGVACIAIIPMILHNTQRIHLRICKNFEKVWIQLSLLFDDTQTVAQSYKAVCTPDFLDTTQN